MAMNSVVPNEWLQKVRRYEELKELEHQEQLEKEEVAQ